MYDDQLPAYLRDAIRLATIGPANLLVWASLIERKELPGTYTTYIYPREMALEGPQQMNGKRVKVTFEIESEAQPEGGIAYKSENVTAFEAPPMVPGRLHG